MGNPVRLVTKTLQPAAVAPATLGHILEPT